MPHYIVNSQWSQNGTGNSWVSMELANGKRFLLGYRNVYPMVIMNYSSHWFKDFAAVSLTDNVFDYVPEHTNSLSPPTSWTYVTSGTRYFVYNETDNVFWYEIIQNLYQGALGTSNVQIDQYSGNAFSNNIKHIDLHVGPSSAGSIGSTLSWPQSSLEIAGYNHNLGAETITMNGIKVTPLDANLRTFEQLYLTGVAGEVVYMGGGAPLMRMRSEQSTEYTVTMDLLSRNASGNPAYSNIQVRLSYKQFKDGNFAATTDRIYEANVNCASTGIGTATFDITGIPKDSIVWYSLLSGTAGYSAECTNCTVVIK